MMVSTMPALPMKGKGALRRRNMNCGGGRGGVSRIGRKGEGGNLGAPTTHASCEGARCQTVRKTRVLNGIPGHGRRPWARRASPKSESTGAGENSELQLTASIALPSAASLLLCNICRICMSIAVLKAAVEFGWSDTVSGLIQSAFLWGYTATQLVGGIAADKYGGKMVMAVSVAWFSIATALTPLAASLGQIPLMAMRGIVGLGEGVALPAMNNLIGSKVPAGKRATALGTSFSGFHSGNILGLLASPFLISTWGWRSLFYVYGALGIPVLLTWLCVVPDGGTSTGLENRKTIPISRILSQRSAWVIFLANFVNHWGYFIYLSWLPTYFNRQFSLNLASSSIFSLLPWAVMAVCSPMSGVLADWLVKNGTSVKSVRKILQCTSFVGTAAALLTITSPLGSRLGVAAPLFMLALGLKALGQAGFVANMSDIAPQSAGKLFGLSNTLGSFGGVLSVTTAGIILERTGSFSLVFQITAFMYITAALLWLWLCDDKPIQASS
mmetsp:Transcript_4463/g.11598  ORF Transcript_4463/g.11598 Transcript_4463/m.11598 type:complete len:499 (-) Transcript_4463:3993-5489(-)